MEHKDKHSGGSFKRVIGLFGGISLVAGMVIGSGVYYLGSTVLERTNMHMGTALLCWIIGGAVSILGGLCFAELGAAMPVAGGMTTYLSKAYGPVFGFINGFCGFLLTASGSIAALAMAAVTAFNGIVPMSDMTIKIIAILIIIFFTALNLRGVRFGSMVQNFSMVVRLIPLVLVIILGLALGNEQPDLSISFNADGSSVGISGAISTIAFATFASLWAYEGWTNLNTVAEEMRNPKRDLPLAIIISVGFITLTYTLFNLAIYKVIPSEEVVSMIESGNLYLGNETINRLMGSAGYWIVLIGMTIGIMPVIGIERLCHGIPQDLLRHGEGRILPPELQQHRSQDRCSCGGYPGIFCHGHHPGALQQPAGSYQPSDVHIGRPQSPYGGIGAHLQEKGSRHGASL